MTDRINLWVPEPDRILHQALGKLAEELGEASKAAARCLIQGFDACEPVTGKLNSEALIEEMSDVTAAISWINELRPADEEHVEERFQRKLNGFHQWQQLLEECEASDDGQ